MCKQHHQKGWHAQHADPNYWGNPPQTPRSSNIPQQPGTAYSAQAAHGRSARYASARQHSTSATGAIHPCQQQRAQAGKQQLPAGTPRSFHTSRPRCPAAPVHPAKRRWALSLQLQLLPPCWLGWVAALHAPQWYQQRSIMQTTPGTHTAISMRDTRTTARP